MKWVMKHPRATIDMLGFIPDFLSEDDLRPAKEQISDNYSHGGGWKPIKKFKMNPDGNIQYPGDPPLILIAETKLRDELLKFYDGSWLAIIQPDGTFEISRLD